MNNLTKPKTTKKNMVLIMLCNLILFGNYTYAQESKDIFPETMTIIIGKEEYTVFCELKAFFKNGWKISNKKLYMNPYRNEDWYEMRYTLSRKENGTKLIPWGTTIQTLEKNGSYIEVDLENRSEKLSKIEDCIVEGVRVYSKYIKEKVCLKNGICLQTLKMRNNFEWNEYPSSSNPESGKWIFSPTDYSDELGFFEYWFWRAIEQKKQSVTFYFDAEGLPMGLEIYNGVGGNKIE